MAIDESVLGAAEPGRALDVRIKHGLQVATDEVYPIRIGPDHGSVAWTVTLHDDAASCRIRAWLFRMGEQPLATLFTVELDETVAPAAEGETPLMGLAPGTYDLHSEGAGCQGAFSLVSR